MSQGVAAHTTAQLPPQNLDAEEYVLGALMLAGAPVDAVIAMLDPRDFYRESHATIYRAAIALHNAGEPIDPITITAELERRGDLQKIATADQDGRARIRELATIVPAHSNAPHHAQRIVDTARRRDQIRIGNEIARVGWEATDDAQARLGELLTQLGDRNAGGKIDVETWQQFSSRSTEDVPTLIDGLWPEAAFGFIAAAPKKGKTWIALAMSIALASGRPFLHFNIRKPRPVVYVALEGHRAAIRARVGCISRGLGLDPDTDDHLENLHLIYKPAGINLADPAWAHELRRATERVHASLLTIDVLRAAARIKENDQGEFSALRANLQPLTDAGISVAMLHHFTKLSDISRDRAPGERMSGSGAMFGALDVGIYITASDDHARKLRLEFDTRDLASPDTLNIQLQGEGTGKNGGYTYRDTAAWTITETGPDEDSLKASPQELYDWIESEGGDVYSKHLCARFEIHPNTLIARLNRLTEMGVDYVGGRGKPARLVIRDTPPPATGEQLDLDVSDDSQVPQLDEFVKCGTSRECETLPHNHAGSDQVPHSSTIEPLWNSESGDLQEKSREIVPHPPTGDAPTPARAGAPPRTHEAADNNDALPDPDQAETWLRTDGFMHDWSINPIIDRWPNLPTATIEHLITLGDQLRTDAARDTE